MHDLLLIHAWHMGVRVGVQQQLNLWVPQANDLPACKFAALGDASDCVCVCMSLCAAGVHRRIQGPRVWRNTAGQGLAQL